MSPQTKPSVQNERHTLTVLDSSERGLITSQSQQLLLSYNKPRRLEFSYSLLMKALHLP